MVIGLRLFDQWHIHSKIILVVLNDNIFMANQFEPQAEVFKPDIGGINRVRFWFNVVTYFQVFTIHDDFDG